VPLYSESSKILICLCSAMNSVDVIEFRVLGKDKATSSQKLKSLFKPLKNAMDSMKASQSALLQMSFANLNLQQRVHSGLENASIVNLSRSGDNYKFIPLCYHLVRADFEDLDDNLTATRTIFLKDATGESRMKISYEYSLLSRVASLSYTMKLLLLYFIAGIEKAYRT